MTSALAARDVPPRWEKEYGMVEVPLSPATASWQLVSIPGRSAARRVHPLRGAGLMTASWPIMIR